MIGDTSGHYRIENANGDGFDGYVYRGSDVNQLNENFSSVATLFLDKIGGSPVRKNLCLMEELFLIWRRIKIIYVNGIQEQFIRILR